jgi:hypothetical protein
MRFPKDLVLLLVGSVVVASGFIRWYLYADTVPALAAVVINCVLIVHCRRADMVLRQQRTPKELPLKNSVSRSERCKKVREHSGPNVWE